LRKSNFDFSVSSSTSKHQLAMRAIQEAKQQDVKFIFNGV